MATSPMAHMAVRNVIASLAKGQASDQGQTDAPIPGGDAAGDQISAQLAELQNADPDTMLQLLKQVKSVLVQLYNRSAFALPEVARGVAAAQKGLDQAVRAAEQGAATIQAVSSMGQISNGAGQPQGGAQPGGSFGSFGGGPSAQ